MNKFRIIFKKEMSELMNFQNLVPLVIIFAGMMLLGNFMGGLMEPDTIIVGGYDGAEFEVTVDRNQVVGFIDNDGSELSNMVRGALAAQGILAEPSTRDPALAMQELESFSFGGEYISVGSLVVINAGFEQALRAGQFTNIDVYTAIDNFAMGALIGGAGGHHAAAVINTILSQYLIYNADIGHNIYFLTNPVRMTEHTYLNQTVRNIPASAVINYVSSQITFVPIIIMLIIMMGSTTLATSVVNEKADKTLETLMTTPVSRMAVLAAKLLAAAVLAALYAVVYIIALQNLGGTMMGGAGFPSDFAYMLEAFGVSFNAPALAVIGGQLFLSVLAGLAIAIIIGMLVDDIKTLGSYILPLTFLIMVPYLLSMFVDINTLPIAARIALYIIPFTHAFTAASNLFTANYTLIIFGFAYQAIFICAVMTLAVRIFNSDKLFTLGQIFANRTKKVSRKLSRPGRQA